MRKYTEISEMIDDGDAEVCIKVQHNLEGGDELAYNLRLNQSCADGVDMWLRTGDLNLISKLISEAKKIAKEA